MLHILLMILKIIGIIIAVILGILVLLIVIVLFVPFRYQADAVCDGTLEGLEVKAQVTWLAHLLKVTVDYRKKELVWKARIAWKTLGSGQEEKEIKKEEVDAHEEELDQKLEEMAEEPEKKKETQTEESDKSSKDSEENAEERKEDLEETEKIKGSRKGSEEGMETAEEDPVGYGRDDSEYGKTTEKNGTESLESSQTHSEHTVEQPEEGSQNGREHLWQRIKENCNKAVQKIRTVFGNIKCTIRKICDKINTLSEKTEEAAMKKDQILRFLSDDVHQKAFRKVKDEIFRMLRKLKPKRLSADIHYGFEDPYVTGQLLAALGVLYPFIGENVSITPDFEQKVLEGELHVAGKIRVSCFVRLLWDLLWSSAVRTTFRHGRALFKDLRSA